LVLSELATTGYLFLDRPELRSLAEPLPGGPSTDFFLDLSKRLSSMIVFGVAELAGMDLFNSAAAVTPEGEVHVYRKTHLFDVEKELFTPGDTGFFTVDFRGAKVGMMVCFDWIFPESARVLSLLGADILAHSANLVLPWAQMGLKIRAVENHVFTVLANRTGSEERGGRSLKYTGGSQITDVYGKVLGAAEETEEKVVVVEIDPQEARDKNVTPRNHVVTDRRTEFYGPLT
jgi:predicted amidohydrolase